MFIDAKLVTTGLDLPGYRIAKTLGVVRGIVLRSRSIIGNIGAGLYNLLSLAEPNQADCLKDKDH